MTAPAESVAADEEPFAPELPLEQQRALEALLAGGSQKDACKQAGISLSTLRQWRGQALFAAALDRGRQALHARHSLAIYALREHAVEVLRELMDTSTSDQARAQACRIAMDSARDTREHDELDARLREIERQLAAQNTLVPAVRVASAVARDSTDG